MPRSALSPRRGRALQSAPAPALAVATSRRRPADALLGLGAAVAALCLGQAVNYGNGMLHGPAVLPLSVGAAAAFAALVLPRWPPLVRAAAAALPYALAAGVVWHFGAAMSRPPLRHNGLTSLDQVRPFFWGLGTAMALAGWCLGSARRPRWPALLALLATIMVALGAWVVQADPAPDIDVHMFHTEAVAALRRGDNPYAITCPNIYAPGDGNYPPQLMRNGRLDFGYIYPPLSLYLAFLAQPLGDYRLGLVACLVLAAAATVWLAPRRTWAVGVLACGVLMPRGLYALEQGWTEPLVLAGLLGGLALLRHRPAAAPWALGAWATSKQYVPIFAPALWLALWPAVPPAQRRAFVLKAAAAALLVLLPFVLWSPTALWHSTVTTHLSFPARDDSLNLIAWWRQQGGTVPGAWLGFAMGLGTLALGLVLCPMGAAGTVFCFGLSFFAFVLFNRQAFLNYYTLVIGCMMAVAAWCTGPPTEVPPPA